MIVSCIIGRTFDAIGFSNGIVVRLTSVSGFEIHRASFGAGIVRGKAFGMILIYGSSLNGKTDHVRGLFYVKTRFSHIWWLPLLPQYSILFIDDGTESYGTEFASSWKSVFTAWIRTFAGIVAVVALGYVGLSTLFANPAVHGGLTSEQLTKSLGIGGLAIGAYASTYLWARPSYQKALRLAKKLDLPDEVVNAHYPVESEFGPAS